MSTRAAFVYSFAALVAIGGWLLQREEQHRYQLLSQPDGTVLVFDRKTAQFNACNQKNCRLIEPAGGFPQFSAPMAGLNTKASLQPQIAPFAAPGTGVPLHQVKTPQSVAVTVADDEPQETAEQEEDAMDGTPDAAASANGTRAKRAGASSSKKAKQPPVSRRIQRTDLPAEDNEVQPAPVLDENDETVDEEAAGEDAGQEG